MDLPITDFKELCVEATYRQADGTRSTITAYFEKEYDGSDLDETSVENSRIEAECNTADLPNLTHACTLIIKGVTYKIMEIQPNATETTNLILTRD